MYLQIGASAPICFWVGWFFIVWLVEANMKDYLADLQVFIKDA
jgi:hypothetical protein